MWLVNFAKMLSFSSYDWFSSFFILSIELPKLAVTSKRRFRYKKAKQVHDLRFDSWILQNCRRSRVMASSPWRPFWTFLRTKPLIVGSLGTSTFDMYCSTAMGFVNSARKSQTCHGWTQYSHSIMVTPTSHLWPRGQHFTVFCIWLATLAAITWTSSMQI